MKRAEIRYATDEEVAEAGSFAEKLAAQLARDPAFIKGIAALNNAFESEGKKKRPRRSR